LAGCCECGDEPSGSGTTELVIRKIKMQCVLNIASKIFCKILHFWVLPYMEKEISIYQCGFKEGNSTIDQIFNLRQVLEKCGEFNIGTHHVFTDYKAAYDSINRSELCKAMVALNIPRKLTRLVKLTTESAECCVRIKSDELRMTNFGK
jgi:sorting nexin-29